MSFKKAGPGSTPANYIILIDLLVAICIVIVAGRPDGLAITVSAAIVAVCALAYRCTVGVRSYVARKKADKARSAARALLLRQRERAEAARQAQATAFSMTRRRRKAWFEDD